MTSHALTNWKSCVKSRGMKCCESSILEKIARVAGTLGTGTLGTGTLGTGTLETGTLGTGTLGTKTLGTGTLGTGTLETGTLETGTLETGTLGTGTNRLSILVVLIQKNRRSCCSINRQI